MNNAIIRFDNVSFQLGSAVLLRSISLEVAEGETLILLGRSGSGKTTTLKLVNRLLEPTSGRVLVEGKSTLEWDPIKLRRRIGYVIQDVGLFPHFTVRRNVGLVPSLNDQAPQEIEHRVNEVLRLVGLDPAKFADRYPHQLSGGQRQRVGVARALAANPSLLLLDEPFGALDPLTRAEIHEEFLALQAKLHKTMVFVTHDVAEALLLGSRIALMENGSIVAIGTRQEFLESRDEVVRTFLAPLLQVHKVLNSETTQPEPR